MNIQAVQGQNIRVESSEGAFGAVQRNLRVLDVDVLLKFCAMSVVMKLLLQKNKSNQSTILL